MTCIFDRIETDVPVETPQQAVELYTRGDEWQIRPIDPIPGTMSSAPYYKWENVIQSTYEHLALTFIYKSDKKGKDVWGVWKFISRFVNGKWIKYHIGDCDDFAAEMVRRLMAQGLPRGAVRFILCMDRGVAHLAVGVETSAGTVVICNDRGIAPYNVAKSWPRYKFLQYETLNGWARVRQDAPKLSQLLPREPQ